MIVIFKKKDCFVGSPFSLFGIAQHKAMTQDAKRNGITDVRLYADFTPR
ncbi:MAG: hypothetical protein SOY26_04025 [Paludibacteraceae bacterium]|nr:hypothetical protein [Bacteroidales bacterium]MDY4148902.1 hypothetical protein [Paludibacteraceae bacterium]